jgi:hypothetical protein
MPGSYGTRGLNSVFKCEGNVFECHSVLTASLKASFNHTLFHKLNTTVIPHLFPNRNYKEVTFSEAPVYGKTALLLERAAGLL